MAEQASGRVPVRVAFKTLGCKVNRVESEDIAADLIGRGAVLVPEDEAALVVVNTCTVTGEADAKARKAVRHALNTAASPIVVVTGCLASLDKAALEALGSRVIVEADKERVADRVARALALEAAVSTGAQATGAQAAAVPAAGGEDAGARAVRTGEGFRTRALLKVEDGCDVFCAYCIVPHARGVPRSVPLAEAVAEARRLVASGVAEIVLTGINLGRYRDDATGGDLAALVEAIAATGVARLRLSSIEPPDLSERLLGVLAATPAACEHLHVPLQSGSDAVLCAMRRSYTIADYEERIAAARAALPGLAVTTDVMAGFPGETDVDAAVTLAACERIGFAKLHVFRYSERPGTPAAQMPGRVPPQLRAKRAGALRELGERLRRDFVATRIGRPAEVLVERIEPATALAADPHRKPAELAGAHAPTVRGTTRDYVRVAFSADDGFAVGDVVSLASLDAETVAAARRS